MEMTTSRDEKAAPTLRSAELWRASQPRRTPVITVVQASRPAWPASPRTPSTSSLLSEVAREVAGTLLDLALDAARARAWWS